MRGGGSSAGGAGGGIWAVRVHVESSVSEAMLQISIKGKVYTVNFSTHTHGHPTNQGGGAAPLWACEQGWGGGGGESPGAFMSIKP